MSPIEGATFIGGSSQGEVNQSLNGVAAPSVLGDVNGDGINDFAFGSNLIFGQEQDELINEGEIVQDILNTPRPNQTRDDRVIITGRIGVDLLGENGVPGLKATSITSAGDVNGDGLADFIVDARRLVYGRIDFGDSGIVNPVTGILAIDATEINTLGGNLDGAKFTGSGSLVSVGDTNADGLADLAFTSTESGFFGETYLILGVSNIPGDLNGDGTVDGEDLNIVLSNFNMGVTQGVWALGDIVADGIVDGDDLNEVLVNFGSISTSSAATVPEASTFCLGVFCLNVCMLIRLKR